MDQTSTPPGTNAGAEKQPATEGAFRVRVFYHWRKPDSKQRHGFAMGVVTAREKTTGAIIAALRQAYPQLEPFDVEIDRFEWR